MASWPTDYKRVTSPFGASTGRKSPHTGLDIENPQGGNVYATHAGVVKSTSPSPEGGNQIVIHNDDGSVSGYAHTAAKVSAGQKVAEGQPIGNSDGSGTGSPHLHYTYRRCRSCAKEDPRPYLP